MDTQLKKGLLDICVLAELNCQDSYGYQIIKDLSPIIEISESTLYPILKRLEERECLKTYSLEHDGRLRRYYQITHIGKEKIEEFCQEWNTISDIINFIRGAK
ncbi:MAG TPA: PadR family transcriptional regulator [Clostridia bacterium]|nr:PadR family transcriptional regulator [Clostridia bacterium]